MGNNGIHLATQLKEKAPFFIGGLGVILLLSALGIEYSKMGQKVSTNPFTATESSSFSRKNINIDIEGAVERPGIYEIPDDSRIQDVLITAGGLTAKANRTMVSRDINLAQRVFDGQKIYIPEMSETTSNTPNVLSSQAISNLININSASEAELDVLSGVGPATAKKIIAGRPYQDISDLLTKHLVSSSVYEKIKNSITTY